VDDAETEAQKIAMTHDEAIAAGYKDETCPRCGKLFEAQIHFIRCDAESLGLCAQ